MSRRPRPQLPLPSPPTFLSRFWARSQTVPWAAIQAVAGSYMAGIHWIVTNPDLKESLIPFHLPAWFGVSLIVIGGLTYAFHGHGD